MPPTKRYFLLCSGEEVGEDKLEKFKERHVIGEVHFYYDRNLEREVKELAIFRHAITNPWDYLSDDPHWPIAALVPEARRIKCDMCDGIAHWDITQSALERLLIRYGVADGLHHEQLLEVPETMKGSEESQTFSYRRN